MSYWRKKAHETGVRLPVGTSKICLHSVTVSIHVFQSVGHLLPPETKCKADRRRFPVSGVDLETFEGQLLGGRWRRAVSTVPSRPNITRCHGNCPRIIQRVVCILQSCTRLCSLPRAPRQVDDFVGELEVGPVQCPWAKTSLSRKRPTLFRVRPCALLMVSA